VKAKYAGQIREGIMAARGDSYWSMLWLFTERRTKLTKRAFVRTQRRLRIGSMKGKNER